MTVSFSSEIWGPERNGKIFLFWKYCQLRILCSAKISFRNEGKSFKYLQWKLNIQKTKIMAFGPITSWEIYGETVETVSDFIFGGSKITAGGDCSHEIKRYFLLERKVMTNLDSIFKSRDITLTTKVCLVKAMVFPMVMYGCESWTVKKAERRRIDAFELWCWRRLLRVSWTARRSKQSILVGEWRSPSPSPRRSALGFLWKEWC